MSVDLIVREFGENAGLRDLALNDRGHVVFQHESGRMLGLEQAEDTLLVYIAQPLDYEVGDSLLRAFKQAHHSNMTDWVVQAALRNHGGRLQLLALTRIAVSELTQLRLQRSVEYLAQWLDALPDNAPAQRDYAQH